VTAAVLRELARKGYPVPAQGSDNVAAVVIPYEFDSQLPLSGEASDLVLKRLIFDQRPAPKGAFADRAEADTRLVLAVQKTLLELGFFAGRLSGQMDSWTQKAVVAFERHRSIPQTGRFTETTLAALIAYSGKPLERVSFPGP
jgi:peptidoglycan hydrolase-like protein with peptidoglycan-binding domain